MIVTKSYIIKIKLYLLDNSFKIDFFNGLGWDNRKIILINMAEVYISNEAYTSLLLKYIFRSGMGQKILTSKPKKRGRATLYHDKSSPEGVQ